MVIGSFKSHDHDSSVVLHKQSRNTQLFCVHSSWAVYLTAAASRLTLTSLHFINCRFCIFMNCVKCIFCTRSVVQWFTCCLQVKLIIGSSPDQIKTKTIKLLFSATYYRDYHRLGKLYISLRIILSHFFLNTSSNMCHQILEGSWFDFDFWCLTPLSTIFQLYHGDQF